MTTDGLWPVESGPPAAPYVPLEGLIDSAATDVPGEAIWPAWEPLDDAQRRPCRRPGCRCTHDNGCEFGWVDVAGAAAPCPTCQPDKIRRHDETRAAWLHRLREARR